MPPRIRRIIFLASLLLFFITGPIILFFASGYQYDFQKNKLVKTGILVVQAFPDEFDVSLDGEKIKGERFDDGIRFTDLLPREYIITVSREGYSPWQKKLRVDSQQTTFANDIVLYKQNETKEILNGQISLLDTKNDKSLLLLSKEEEGEALYILTHKNQKAVLIKKFAPEISIASADFSSGNNKILIRTTEAQHLVLDLRNTTSIANLAVATGETFTQSLWSDQGEYLMYLISDQKIKKLNLTTGKTETMADLDLKKYQRTHSQFFLKNNHLYFFIDDQDKVIFMSKRISGSEPAEEIASLFLGSNPYFLSENTDLPNFYNPSESQFYFFDEAGEKIIKTMNTRLVSTSKKYHLESDGYELKLWNHELTKQRFIYRQSNPINIIGVLNPFEYAYYTDPNGLFIIELDTRDRPNIYQISETKKITDVWVDQKNTWMFFISSDPENPGIFGVNIEDPSTKDFFSLLSNTSA